MYIANLIPTPLVLSSENDNTLLSNKKVDEITRLEDKLKHQINQKFSIKPGAENWIFKNTLNELSKLAELKKKKKNVNKVPRFIVKKSVFPGPEHQSNFKTNIIDSRKKNILKQKNTKKTKKTKPKIINKKIEKEWNKIESLVKQK